VKAEKLKGKRELYTEETDRLKRLWKKLARMFHPNLHEHDPEKRKTYERLTQAINEARDRGDIKLLELIAKDPQAFILKQGWASVSFDPERGLKELRSLYEHLQAWILEMIEPSSLKLRWAEVAPWTVWGGTRQPRCNPRTLAHPGRSVFPPGHGRHQPLQPARHPGHPGE
jgi:hypothetical protein